MSEDSSSEETPPPDVLGMALRLAEIIKKDEEAIDLSAIEQGDAILAISRDPSYTNDSAEFKKEKILLIRQAIEDLSARGKTLSKAMIGIYLLGTEHQPFVCPYGELPRGPVVFSIELIDPDTFLMWRNGQTDDLTEDDLHAAIYRLAVEWASLL